ncbi:hypothetical protein Ahy_A02g006474 [Arachis hypogaea]|uniref:Reverse transcriptase zinc-binding domain-containing protein n=1 Tax=Arachis hypogaea TaxID=3818 RepID=A0A445EA27_ARAHY|nr:hypothetical protein Ahy_A02g006474 [Arachis hypogaea]
MGMEKSYPRHGLLEKEWKMKYWKGLKSKDIGRQLGYGHGEGIETTEHAILLCPWTRATWFGAQSQCLPTPETVKSFAKWLLEMCRKIRGRGKKEAEDLIGRIGMLNWKIWKTRNQTIF